MTFGLFLLLLVLIVFSSGQNFLCDKYSESYPGKENMTTPVFTVVSGGIVAAVSFAAGGFAFSACWQTWVFGVVNALAIFLYNLFLIRSMQRGPYSIVMVFIIAGNIIVPAAAEMFLGNFPTLIKIACMAVVIAAVYLVSVKKGDSGTKKFKKGFWPSVFFLFLTNGVYCSILALGEDFGGQAENPELLVITYGGSAILSIFPMLFSEKKAFFKAFKQTRKSTIFMLACSLVIAGGMLLLSYLLAKVEDDTFLYTVQAASVMLFSVVIACVFFREKLSVKNIIGCAMMCVGIIVVSLWGDVRLPFFG